MAQQVRTKLPNADELNAPPYQMISSRLQLLEATSRITHEPGEDAITDLKAYYVEGLVEVSTTPAHHLLKSWSAIQGRDLSPKRLSATALRRQQQLEQVYAELEAHFGNRQTEEEELDELEKLVADNMIEEDTPTPVKQKNEQFDIVIDEKKIPTPTVREKKEKDTQTPTNQIKVSSPLKEPPDKRARISNVEKENLQPQTSTLSTLSEPTLHTRCASPDLFADSDEEEETSPKAALTDLKLSPQIYNATTSNEINCYEIYSSDEGKYIKF